MTVYLNSEGNRMGAEGHAPVVPEMSQQASLPAAWSARGATVVAMSGGVDSSVAAALLSREVEALNLNRRRSAERSCARPGEDPIRPRAAAGHRHAVLGCAAPARLRRAAAAGQAAVLYSFDDPDVVLGGGTICRPQARAG